MDEHYECDQCGACCRQLIVEADAIDVLREPRLIECDSYYQGKTREEVLDLLIDDGRVINVTCAKPCRFLDGNECGIYPTRPNECVAMLAGEDPCQLARKAEGLQPLLPIRSES